MQLFYCSGPFEIKLLICGPLTKQSLTPPAFNCNVELNGMKHCRLLV